jgi:H+/Cl- antiporter ClcA
MIDEEDAHPAVQIQLPVRSVMKNVSDVAKYSAYVDTEEVDNANFGEDERSRRRSVSSNVSETHRRHKTDGQSQYLGWDVLILLFILGLVTGVINGCVAWVIRVISGLQARILTAGVAGPFFFVLTMTVLCGLSAYIIKKGGLTSTYGPGMAEVKALLVSDFHLSEFPAIVSAKIFCLRVASLILATGAGLSIGVAAPLVHAALCTAYCFMRFVKYFRHLMDNPAMLKQIFAASAAVGMSTVFNAPVGGLLFSIEVTSTYYLISNYWRSFMAATTGAVMYNIFLAARKSQGRIYQIDTVTDPYEHWEYLSYIVLGLLCGLLALGYLKLHQAYYLAMRRFLTDNPVACAAAAGAITAVLIYATNAHSEAGVSESVLVKDLFQSGNISEMHTRGSVSRLGGLFASLVVRVFLTIIGTTSRLSAGVFLPMFTLGAMLGRIMGQIVLQRISQGVYVPGYAMVGAAAFLSGTTHTISAAVIVVEMTGEIDMLLPCLIGAVIACGITKSRSLSLYDQGMVNKGLESFELLLEATGGFNFAEDVMDSQVVSVTRSCTVSDLFMLLSHEAQQTFPVIETTESCRLVASVERRDVFHFLRELFAKHGEAAYTNRVLALDAQAEELRLQRDREVALHESWLITHHADAVPGAAIAKRLFPSSYRLSALDASTTSVDSGWGGEGIGESPRSDNSDAGITPNPIQRGAGARAAHLSATRAAAAVNSSLEEPVSPSDDARIEQLLAESVDLSQTPGLPINGFPFTAHRQSTMDQLYVLFEMVKVKVVFVVAEDKTLEGMISKNQLLLSLKKKVN